MVMLHVLSIVLAKVLFKIWVFTNIIVAIEDK